MDFESCMHLQKNPDYALDHVTVRKHINISDWICENVPIEKLAILIPELQKTSFLNAKAFENNEGFLKVEEECEEERK